MNNISKKITTLAILLIMAGLASAAIVTYLADAKTTTVSLESPTQLKIYNTSLAEISTTQSMYAGETLEFFKIAKNNSSVGTKFAIVLLVKGTKDGIIVDSAGPKVDAGNTVDSNGVPLAWNNTELWWQNNNEDWYLHGAHQTYSDYEWWNTDTNAFVAGSNPQNNEYNDAEGITINDINYYIVVFGGTIGDNELSVNTPINASDTITNWGWGTPTSYTKRVADTPLIMQPNAFDVGKIRVYFAQNLEPAQEYIVKMAVVQPHSTIENIVGELFG